MATNQEWHYVKDGTQHGPVSSSDLEALATSGELSPSDLIWQEGMANWKSAGKFKGLFPEINSSNDADQKPSTPTTNANTPSTEPEPIGKRSLIGTAKSAAQFATNKAERTKLTSLTLPSLYQALGRHCYSSQQYRDEFTELFQKLDQIQSSITEIASREQPTTKTLGDKAKAIGGQAMQAVESKKLSLRLSSLLGSLGQVVYEKHGEKSGPQDLAKPIHDTLTRISTLDHELKTLSTTESGLGVNAKQTVMGILFHPAIALLSMLMCFPIGLILVWKNPEWTTVRKLRWTGGFCAVAFALAYLGIHTRHEATTSLASANQLWSAGDKDMAVPKYKRAISLALSVIPEGERPVVFKRVVEHEAERGNQASAKELIETALNKHVPLNLERRQAKEIMVAVQAERQRVQHGAAAKEKEAAIAKTEKANRHEPVAESKRPAKQQQAIDTTTNTDARRAKNRQERVPARTMTKKEFVEKLRAKMSSGRIDDLLVQATFTNYSFQDSFGDPDSNVEWKDSNRLISYRCRDGSVQLTVLILESDVILSGVNQY